MYRKVVIFWRNARAIERVYDHAEVEHTGNHLIVTTYDPENVTSGKREIFYHDLREIKRLLIEAK